jgi:HEAT repeat protein
MKLTVPLVFVTLVGCGGGSAPAKSAESTPTHTTSATSSPTTPTSSALERDPKIMQLAKGAATCTFEDDRFDDDCAGYKAWKEEDDLFSEGKANETLFAMLGDPDVKMRVLATDKSIDNEYFDDHAKVARLIALVKAEHDDAVARDLMQYLTKTDVDKLGVASEISALAKSPSATVRTSLASIISRNQGPTAIAILRTLLEDSDHDVRREAISSLSTGGITPGVESVCKLLGEQIARTDDLAGDALWAGSSSKCSGMDKRVIDELKKRVADPSQVTNAVGIGYQLAVSGVCRRTSSPELKKAGFAIAKALVSPAVKDSNTRRSALDALVTCDPTGAVAVVRSLTTDKEKFVADGAKKILAAKH